MTSELTVNVQPDSIQIAITEDHNLVEYQKDAQEVTFAVGNLYLGRVKKLMPGLNACFVDVGSEKEAFLHYQDLGPQFMSLKKYIKQVRANRKKLAPFAKAQFVPFDEKQERYPLQDVSLCLSPSLTRFRFHPRSSQTRSVPDSSNSFTASSPRTAA